MSNWPPEKLYTLRRLWAEGELSARAIGAKIGKTRGAVIGKAHRLGLKHGFLDSKTTEPPVITMRPLAPKYAIPTDDLCAIHGCRKTHQPGRVRCAEHHRKTMPKRTRALMVDSAYKV